MIDARVIFLEMAGYALHVQDVQRLHREGVLRRKWRFTLCPGPRCMTWVLGGGLCSFCRRSA